MLKKRSDVANQDKWNVEALYPTHDEWKKEYTEFCQDEKGWKPLETYRGKLTSPKELKEALTLLMKCAQKLSKLYTYAHLRHDEDIADNENKISYNQIMTAVHHFQQAVSWLEPEIISLSDEQQKKILNDPALSEYRFHLEKIIRIKAHTLPPEQEQLLASSGRALQTAHKTFSALNDADLSFGTAEDSSGKEHSLTHATMGLLLRSHDRHLRQNAFIKMHSKFGEFSNTLAELLHGQTQNHLFQARARGYTTCLDAALFPKNIETSVYHSLIDSVNNNLAPLHKYLGLRKQVLGLNNIHLYDMYVPLTPDFDITMNYDKAEHLVIESVAPLGTEYQDILHKGLKTGRWVDRYENKGKRSGAYSSGCYDSMPYILMNYKEILRDVFTLAHEAGHSMHSYYSHKAQPYQYSDYPIFLAEVASTFNEELLTRHMLKTCTNMDEKIFLLNQKIEDIRATFYRQTMFAEFELLIHTAAEKGQPLTPHYLNSEYRKLNAKYFGPSVILDDASDSEWSRIPHFYYNFYVFQYATGISAALALAERVCAGGKKEREDYLGFLKGGCSRYPQDLLKGAGVDMTKPLAVQTIIKTFESMVDELSNLLKIRDTQKIGT